MQWSALEYITACAIWQLTGIRDIEVGKIVTAHLDLKQRVGMAFALSHQVNAPISFRNAIKKLQTSLRDEDLIHERNQAVHGVRFPSDQPDAADIEMHRGKGGRQPVKQTNAELEQVGHKIAELRKEFTEALAAYLRKARGEKIEELESYKALLDILRNNSPTID